MYVCVCVSTCNAVQAGAVWVGESALAATSSISGNVFSVSTYPIPRLHAAMITLPRMHAVFTLHNRLSVPYTTGLGRLAHLCSLLWRSGTEGRTLLCTCACALQLNSAPNLAGAIEFILDSGAISLTGNAFVRNTAGANAGAILFFNSTLSASVTNSVFQVRNLSVCMRMCVCVRVCGCVSSLGSQLRRTLRRVSMSPSLCLCFAVKLGCDGMLEHPGVCMPHTLSVPSTRARSHRSLASQRASPTGVLSRSCCCMSPRTLLLNVCLPCCLPCRPSTRPT